MLKSHTQRRKPAGKPIPRRTARANEKTSAIRTAVEHVFARQKSRFGLFIHTIGLARAEAELTLANLAFNLDRLIVQERRQPCRRCFKCRLPREVLAGVQLMWSPPKNSRTMNASSIFLNQHFDVAVTTRTSHEMIVNIDRFWQTLETSSSIGTGREGGLSRLALDDADRQIRDVFVKWCKDAGYTTTIDHMGCIFARRGGLEDLPPVLIGSHLDTQANGGRFDGICGVLAGLEVLRCLDDNDVETRRPVEMVNWTNEEGARFSPPMIGSGVAYGGYDLEFAYSRKDTNGLLLGDELERIGYKGSVNLSDRDLECYFELHIEQGDELYRSNREVGIVTHAYMSHGMIVEYCGETAHTGPWPMEKRRNALVAAARFLVSVDDIGWSHAGTAGKATAARLEAWPNRAGSLSDWSQAVADVRHEDPRTAEVMRVQMVRAAHQAGVAALCETNIIDEWHYGGDIFDKGMAELTRHTAGKLGYTTMDLPSQAGHDAYYLAMKCPTAMIFTPCEDGITHNNKELATQAHLEPALNVLLNAVVAKANC